jgi:hypothetical protein
MRNILYFLLLCLSSFSFAQFQLEHTYNENEVTRVKLEIDGEKYYLVNKATSQADFYNADHSFWKSIPLPAPPQIDFLGEVRIWHVSQTKINADSNIELIYSFQDHLGTNLFYTKVISENGTVLLSVENTNNSYISEIEGLPTKLIVFDYQNTSKVYSFPELILENTYQITQEYLQRIKMTNAGEKYYYFDKLNGQANFFNADHSFWKVIDLPKPADATYLSISLVDDNIIGNSSLIKIGYSYSSGNGNGTTYAGNIINENGYNLLSNPNTESYRLSNIDGLSPKIITRELIPNSNFQFKSTIYSAPSLTLEHEYGSLVARTVLENSGEKYYTTQSPLNNQVKIYNADHSIWKTVYLPIPEEFYQVTEISNLSENKFNSDDLVEFTCGYKFDFFAFETLFENRVLNENGLSLLTVPDAFYLRLNELPNLNNKIIGLMDFGGVLAQPRSGTVYNTGVLGTTNFNKSNISIAPNPVKNEFTIFSTKAIVEVNIFDAIGKLILTKKDSNLTKIEVQNLSNGIYFAKMKADNNTQFTQKIIISN